MFYVGMGISAIALIWIIWFQYKEKNHLIYMNIVKSRNFVINSPQTLENLCVNPLFRTGDNLTGNFKEEYNTY